MAITIIRRPYEYCFSGNPVTYLLQSSLAATDNSVFIEIKVRYKYIKEGYITLPGIPFSPDSNGYVSINIQDILEGILEIYVPPFGADETAITSGDHLTAQFYIIFREITSLNPDPSWDESEGQYERFVLKGGLSKGKYRGNNFWVNYFGPAATNALKPFLTWQKSGRLASIKERMYLGFLVDQDIGTLKVRATAIYTDNTTSEIVKEIDEWKGIVFSIPAGAFQWGLVDAEKQIWYWTIQVWNYADENNPVQFSQAFKYFSDNRNNYNDVTLYYHNSFSCLDSVRIRGVITKSIDYDITEQDVTLRADYFSGHFIAAEKAIAMKRENLTWKGDVGHLEKEEQDRLRDFQLAKEVWWPINNKWFPVLITTPNINNFRSSDDKRFSMPVEWKLAFSGEEYYTPDSVDLGDGMFTDNTCLAYISDVDIDVDLSGDDAIITVTFTENDPRSESLHYRYRVLTEGVWTYYDWATAEYGTYSFTFLLPKEVVTYLELQAVSSLGIAGKKTITQIDTRVAIDPPSGSQSSFYNNSSTTDLVTIKVNGTDIVTTRFAGSYGRFTFDFDSASNATVEIEMVFRSPAWAYLSTGGVEHGPSEINGLVIVFENITITDGMDITIV